MPPGAPPPIGAHRLLGGGRSAALLRPTGELDWWCAPEPDDPPLLWSLLDPAAPSARWRGARLVGLDEEPAGPTARTELAVDGQRVECWDGLVSQDGGAVLVRLVRSGGPSPPALVHDLALGGFEQPRVSWVGGTGRLGDRRVVVRGGCVEAHGRRLEVHLRPSTAWQGFVVVVGEADDLDLEDLPALLRRAEAEAGRRLVLPRDHPDRVEDAFAVLQACTHPSGGILAAVTTSLPEVPGGDRQFDYRYTWLRDASLAAAVTAEVGDRRAVERHLTFLCDLDRRGALLEAPLFDPRGGPVPAERQVEGVAGWGGSRPVRVGNEARGQLQYDALGFVLEAVQVAVAEGLPLGDDVGHLVGTVADRLAREGPRPSSGIWELRQPEDLLSADIGRWLALDRAVRLARRRRPWRAPASWRRARREARRRVLGAIRPDGSLPQSHVDGARKDASALLLVVTGLVRPRSRRARRLIRTTVEALEADGFLHRYEPDGRDGFDAGEGAFVPASWWVVSALAASGQVVPARARADALCAALPRLMAEQHDPALGASLGNTPLVWSHAECARALHLVEVARVRRRWGPVGLAVWRVLHRRRARRVVARHARAGAAGT